MDNLFRNLQKHNPHLSNMKKLVYLKEILTFFLLIKSMKIRIWTLTALCLGSLKTVVKLISNLFIMNSKLGSKQYMIKLRQI